MVRLDALEPTVIGQLITDEVERVRDYLTWREAEEAEEAERAHLRTVAKRWPEVVAALAR